MSRFLIPKGGPVPFKGYNSDNNNTPADYLSYPCINCMIDSNGKAAQRLGYAEETDIDLAVPNNPATCFYLKKYDITVFALGTKLKYFDWNTRLVYDTGVTLTAGTITRMDKFSGDIYTTNTTDGLRRLVFGRLNDAAATLGDATFTIDSDMAARLSVFGLTSGTILVQGTSEAYASLVVSTGVVTHSTTLSKSYNDNAVCVRVHDISSGREKASKPFVWKNRLGLIGSLIADNADQPNATEFFGKFATPLNLEDFIDFTYGAGGSTREIVGTSGKVTNAVPAKDYLYSFDEDQGYACAAADVVISGSAIGQTTPELKDELHGCLNEDAACVIGNNEISYITNDKRIVRIKIATDTGAPVIFPDESFDIPLQVKYLTNMDRDQTGARAFYHKAKKRSIYQVKVLGQWYWFIYDHAIKIVHDDGTVTNGAWQPPQQVIFAQDFFEREGILYATDGTDDTVYSIGTTFDDNLQPVPWTFATGNFNVGNAVMKTARVWGEISQAAMIKLQTFVTNRNGGRQGGSQKIIDGATFSYSDEHQIGADAVGEGGVEQESVSIADWDTDFDIYPSEGSKCQLIAMNDNGGYCSISLYSLEGTQRAHSSSNSQ